MLALPFLKETAETTDDLATREACLALADEIAANAGNQPYIQKHLIVINALNPSKNARAKGILLKLSKGHPDSVITQAAKNALNND